MCNTEWEIETTVPEGSNGLSSIWSEKLQMLRRAFNKNVVNLEYL